MADSFQELRALEAAAPEPPAGLAPYLEKVRAAAYTVTDADVEGLKAAGFSEDEIFQATVTVAIGEGLRRLDAALEAIGVESKSGVRHRRGSKPGRGANAVSDTNTH